MSPNAPRTPHRTIRINNELWDAAKEAAAEDGETVSDLLRRLLENHLAQRSKEK